MSYNIKRLLRLHARKRRLERALEQLRRRYCLNDIIKILIIITFIVVGIDFVCLKINNFRIRKCIKETIRWNQEKNGYFELDKAGAVETSCTATHKR
ncbi:hypothetical protein KJ885_05250 [Patescibacteria group bacterium]|nr:hypothetical protein [Patescibacteria group bacterium]